MLAYLPDIGTKFHTTSMFCRSTVKGPKVKKPIQMLQTTCAPHFFLLARCFEINALISTLTMKNASVTMSTYIVGIGVQKSRSSLIRTRGSGAHAQARKGRSRGRSVQRDVSTTKTCARERAERMYHKESSTGTTQTQYTRAAAVTMIIPTARATSSDGRDCLANGEVGYSRS